MHIAGNIKLQVIHQYRNGNTNLILTIPKVSFSLKQNTKIKSKIKVDGKGVTTNSHLDSFPGHTDVNTVYF